MRIQRFKLVEDLIYPLFVVGMGRWQELTLKDVIYTYYLEQEDHPFVLGPINLTLQPGVGVSIKAIGVLLVGGMVISAALNLPSGPSIVATQLAIFLTAMALPRLWGWVQEV